MIYLLKRIILPVINGSVSLLLVLCFVHGGYSQATSSFKNAYAHLKTTSHQAQFVENKGQWPEEVRFQTSIQGMNVWFTEDGIRHDAFIREKSDEHQQETIDSDELEGLQIKGQVWDLQLINSNYLEQSLEGVKKQETYYNYFLGNDSTKWAHHVPVFAEVFMEEVYSNIDLRYYGNQDHQLEYDFIVKPGGSPDQISFEFKGLEFLNLDEEGNLLLGAKHLDGLMQTKPYAYQIVNGKEVEVTSEYVLDDGIVSFRLLTDYHRNIPLIIDPITLTLEYSTYVSGPNSYGYSYGLAVTSSNEAVICGRENRGDFPTTTGAYDTLHNGDNDAFVSMISSDGSSLIWSTYLGSRRDDFAYNVVLDGNENVLIAGETEHPTFPTTVGAFDVTNSEVDAFVAKLSADGSSLMWSTFLGGGGADRAYDLALDGSENVVVTGYTKSSNFPITFGVFDDNYDGGKEAFVSKLSPDGSTMVWSSFLGGTDDEEGYAVRVNSMGEIVVSGYTASLDFNNTVLSYDTSYNGGNFDVFLSTISNDGSSLIWSSFLGGNSGEKSYSLTLDGSDNPIVTGYTWSSDFPVTGGVFDSIIDIGPDIFVSKFDVWGALMWSTFLGGSAEDTGYGLAVDNNDNVYVLGHSSSADFPTTPMAFDTSYHYAGDITLTVMSADGSSLDYSTFMGGNFFDYPWFSNVVVKDTFVYFTATVHSTDFPTTTGAFMENKPTSTGTDTPVVTKWNITDPCAAMNSAVNTINVSCYNGNDGWFTVSTVGAIPPYTYNIGTGPQSSPTFSGLAAGWYNVVITSSDGCINSLTVTITQPSVMEDSITVVDATCGNNNGAVSIFGSGGTAPYTYDIGNGPQSNGAFNNLAPGAYNIIIIDSNGCAFNDTFTVNNLPNLTPAIIGQTNVGCAGDSSGSFTVASSVGTSPFLYDIGGVQQASGTFTGLAIGTYMVNVEDANGCVGTTTVTITEPLPLTISISTTDESCIDGCDGSILFSPSGGTLPYSYSIDNCVTQQNNMSFSGLCSGAYQACLIDSNGCNVVLTTTVAPGVLPQADAGIIHPGVLCVTDSVLFLMANDPGGTWSGNGIVDSITGEFDPAVAGTGTFNIMYTITGTCGDTNTIAIEICGDLTFTIPNVFSPNADGVNDLFFIANEGLTALEGAIFNRWGQKMFEWNTLNGKWDGRAITGVEAPEGTYYCIIKAVGFDGEVHEKQGYFMLVR